MLSLQDLPQDFWSQYQDYSLGPTMEAIRKQPKIPVCLCMPSKLGLPATLLLLKEHPLSLGHPMDAEFESHIGSSINHGSLRCWDGAQFQPEVTRLLRGSFQPASHVENPLVVVWNLEMALSELRTFLRFYGPPFMHHNNCFAMVGLSYVKPLELWPYNSAAPSGCLHAANPSPLPRYVLWGQVFSPQSHAMPNTSILISGWGCMGHLCRSLSVLLLKPVVALFFDTPHWWCLSGWRTFLFTTSLMIAESHPASFPFCPS